MMPYTHNLFDEDGISLTWQAAGSSDYLLQYNLRIVPNFTGVKVERALERLFCHYLLDRVPDEGLDEMRKALTDAVEFYLPRNDERKVLSSIRHLNSPIRVAINEPKIRPVFEIEEDKVD